MSFDEYADWIEVDIDLGRTTRTWGVVTPRITGSISILSSALIIHVIMRSSTRLSSTYHRIMMSMSIHDIIGSVAVALTTLPFPKDDKWVDVYNYDGMRLGNYATCSAQGFLQFYGFFGSYFYYQFLVVYYVCTVVFAMQPKKINTLVEPFMHIITIAISVWFSLDILLDEGYNPAPRVTSWCTMTPLPYSCLEPSPSPPCERGTKRHHLDMVVSLSLISACQMVVIFTCLSMVCFKVTSLYLALRKSRRSPTTAQRETDLDNQYQCVRATFIQAISYIMVLLITTLPSLVVLFIPDKTNVVHYMPSITLPLQGVFNFAIFVGAKVYYLRRTNLEISFIKALHEILFKTSFEDDAEAIILTGVPSAMGARDSILPSVLSTNLSVPPGVVGSSKSEEATVDHPTSKSQSLTSSVGAWEDVSWISRSTQDHSARSNELSEFGSRGNLPDGLSEAPSQELSRDLSLATRQT